MSIPVRSRVALVVGAFSLLPIATILGSGTAEAGRQKAGDSVADRLKTFDELDFDVFSHQQWDRLPESHSEDIVVTWPDGRQTRGLAQHVEDLKGFFAFAPDTQINAHPIRFGSGEWTGVTSVMTGTFSRPMRTPDGQLIPPSGKGFSIGVATIGQWKNGRMVAEWLFWDNQTFMRQIGLAP